MTELISNEHDSNTQTEDALPKKMKTHLAYETSVQYLCNVSSTSNKAPWYSFWKLLWKNDR